MIAVGIVLACGPNASALDPALDVRHYAHTAWISREGFAPGQITSIAQTLDGYLWLGTEFGLLRFDGARSVPWHPPGNERLPNNWIRSLLVTPDGTLWIGTLTGVASWKDGKLTPYPKLVGHSVNALIADREGTVWAGGYLGGVGLLQRATATLCAIKNGIVHCDDRVLGEWVVSLFEDRGGTLWATAETGLWRVRPGVPKHYDMPMSAISSLQNT